MPDRFETPRLWLRRYRGGDADDLAVLKADPETMRWMWSGTCDRQHCVDAIDSCMTDKYMRGLGFLALIDKATGEFVGECGIVHRDDITSIGYLIKRDHWGKGLAAEAVIPLLRHGFSALGRDEIWASTDVGHVASRRVMEKLGMSFRHEQTIANQGRTAFYAITRAELAHGAGYPPSP